MKYLITYLPIPCLYFVDAIWYEDGPFGLEQRKKRVMSFSFKSQAERWVAEQN